MQTPDSTAVSFFQQNGYAIFPGLLDADELETLGSVCDELLAEPPENDGGGQQHDINRGHDRRFLAHRHQDFPALAAFALGPSMRDFVSQFIGKKPHLFNEQFVVKGPETGAAFGWHQDSGYVGFDHAPYLSVWIAIDDATAENGPVFVLPRDLTKDASVVPHRWSEEAKELVGYEGPDPGVAAIVPAGSVVVFSSVTLHRSSTNTSDKPRRAYLAQYSEAPIVDPETGKPKTFATPL